VKIAVIGSGGVGGYFGGRLAQAGHEVTFVARGRHLAAIRESGLRIDSARGTATVAAANATHDPALVGACDFVMFCVKLWDVDEAARKIAPLVANGGAVIPFQNGLYAHEALQREIGSDKVLGGVAYIAATIREPGVIAHTGTMARLVVGALAGGDSQRAHAFAQACAAAAVECAVSDDITRTLWEKFCFLSALSGTTSLARQPLGVIRSDPDLRATFEAAVREAWTLGRARGVALADDAIGKAMTALDSLPAEMHSSMQNDLAAGNRLEAPWLSGAVARMSRESNLPAPVSATIFAALKPYIDGTPRRT
jgi:2-dehydropantoate 2-reductase